MNKTLCFFLMIWVILPSSAQVQSIPNTAGSNLDLRVSAYLVSVLPSQPLAAGAPFQPVPTQRFGCDATFALDQCKRDMLVLQKTLAKYPMSSLRNWTWVLVRSQDWAHILLARGFSPNVPAITVLAVRTTFIEEALVAGSPGRVSELMDGWHLGRAALLDLAVRHELGHALCNNDSENQANRIATLLEQRKPFSCNTKAAR